MRQTVSVTKISKATLDNTYLNLKAIALSSGRLNEKRWRSDAIAMHVPVIAGPVRKYGAWLHRLTVGGNGGVKSEINRAGGSLRRDTRWQRGAPQCRPSLKMEPE